MVKGIWRIQEAKRWLKYRLASRAIILMYHRVAELPDDPFMLAVTPERFSDHLEVIRRLCSPIRLEQLVEALKEGKVPNRAVVITFDDGYADNLYEAKPILERFEIPATVFVAAGHTGSRSEFWWDELDRLLLQPGTLPVRLHMGVNGSAIEWELGSEAVYTEQDFKLNQGWHVEKPDDPGSRHRLFRCLYDQIQPLDDLHRQIYLDELRDWAGAGISGRSSHRALSVDELVLLEKGGLLDVGAHTVTHPFLAALPRQDQRDEIRQGREILENSLKHPVKNFAIPYGSYTPETISILREEGFDCACSSQSDALWRGTDPFLLPRLGVRNWDDETFEHWLKWWVDG